MSPQFPRATRDPVSNAAACACGPWVPALASRRSHAPHGRSAGMTVWCAPHAPSSPRSGGPEGMRSDGTRVPRSNRRACDCPRRPARVSLRTFAVLRTSRSKGCLAAPTCGDLKSGDALWCSALPRWRHHAQHLESFGRPAARRHCWRFTASGRPAAPWISSVRELYLPGTGRLPRERTDRDFTPRRRQTARRSCAKRKTRGLFVPTSCAHGEPLTPPAPCARRHDRDPAPRRPPHR